MRKVFCLLLLSCFAWNGVALPEYLFSFKDRKAENYILVHYDDERILFEECLAHTPCHFFGDIEVSQLERFLGKLASDHRNSVLEQFTLGSTIAVGSILFMFIGEAAWMQDREQMAVANRMFIGGTILPFLCGVIPFFHHEDARAYNIALTLERRMKRCDRDMKKVNFKQLKESIDELIDVLE